MEDKISFNLSSALWGSIVGGSLKLSLILNYGIITFPALLTYGKLEIPVMVNWGLHALFRTKSKVLFETNCIPYIVGKSLTWFFPTISASYTASWYLTGGISTSKSLITFPVCKFYIFCVIKVAILKTFGTTPELSPLWTPSFKFLTVIKQLTQPLKELVIHNLS